MRGKHMHVWMCRHVKLVHSWTSSLCHRLSWVGLWDFSLLPKTRFLGSVPNRTNALLLFFFFWLCTSRLQLIQKKFCLLWFRELLHSPQWPPKYIRVLIHHSPHLSFSRNFTLLLPSHHKLLKKKKGHSILGLSFFQFRPNHRVQVFVRVSHFQCQAETT